MKTFLLAAVAAATLGMTGLASADQLSTNGSSAAQSQVVMPNQRAGYLKDYATNDGVLPNQRAGYLKHYAQNDVVMPNQRANYLNHYA